MIANYLRPDLLIIDDMGMKQLPKRSGECLFEIIMRRHQTRSIIMTSNRPLEDWGKLLGDVPSASAILDRFLHHAEIITFQGRSYRLRSRLDDESETTAEPAAGPKPASAPTGNRRPKSPPAMPAATDRSPQPARCLAAVAAAARLRDAAGIDPRRACRQGAAPECREAYGNLVRLAARPPADRRACGTGRPIGGKPTSPGTHGALLHRRRRLLLHALPLRRDGVSRSGSGAAAGRRPHLRLGLRHPAHPSGGVRAEAGDARPDRRPRG